MALSKSLEQIVCDKQLLLYCSKPKTVSELQQLCIKYPVLKAAQSSAKLQNTKHKLLWRQRLTCEYLKILANYKQHTNSDAKISIAHTEHLCCVMQSNYGMIGVDTESVTRNTKIEAVQQLLTDKECQWLDASISECDQILDLSHLLNSYSNRHLLNLQQLKALLLWTIKESLAKATGKGIGRWLQQVDIIKKNTRQIDKKILNMPYIHSVSKIENITFQNYVILYTDSLIACTTNFVPSRICVIEDTSKQTL